MASSTAYVSDEAKKRRTFVVTYPRAATADQVLAFTRSLSGLLPPEWQRYIGSPSVVIAVAQLAAGRRFMDPAAKSPAVGALSKAEFSVCRFCRVKVF